MTTTSRPAPQGREPAARTIQPILIATDGRTQSDSAFDAARVVSDDGNVVAVAVLEPLPIVTPEVPFAASPDVERKREADLLARAAAQTKRCLGGGKPWPVEMRVGDPPVVIAQVARDLNARMIVVGLGRHGIVDRLFGDETALELVRHSRVPVLAVPEEFVRAPRRIVVAVDFTQTSTRAARQAIELGAESAHVYLVHVVPRGMGIAAWESWAVDYQRDVESEFAKLTARLTVPAGIVMERVVVAGDPAREVLDFAARNQADLIAVGTHGHGFVARLILGGVATKVLRGAKCAVLTVPHEVPARERPAPRLGEAEPADQPGWRTALDEFTRRNVGRRGILEVDDPRIGAQAQAWDYVFLGVTYDPHDGRLALMLGEMDAEGPHLTRSIQDVAGVDVMRDGAGRDVALRIAHGEGQTLLTL